MGILRKGKGKKLMAALLAAAMLIVPCGMDVRAADAGSSTEDTGSSTGDAGSSTGDTGSSTGDEGTTTTAPKITKAVLINSRDIELYWSEDVTGADTESNFSITVDGKENKIYSYTWEEYNYTEKGIVYYNQKTSLRMTDEITNLTTLPEIKVTVAGDKIKNSAGTYAPEQVITVDNYDAFYQKEITLDCGVKILGTKVVSDEAMSKAEEMMKIVLANEEVAKRMGDAGCMLGIYGEGQIAYDIPEHRYDYDENYLYVEGFGGTQLASIKDANVLRLTTGSYQTGYADESILVHEFGHTVQNFGLSEAQSAEWEKIYASSVTNGGKWANSYAGSNSSEYFATLSAIWFNAMNDTEDGKWDGVRGPINTREELKLYDKAAYDFMSKIYVSDQYLPEPWQNGSVPDNYTYTGSGDDNPTPTPTASYQKIVSKGSASTTDTCIEVNGGQAAAGATVDVWYDFEDTAYLGWTFEKTEDNYYKITFYNSGLVLMPKDGSKADGAAMTLGTDTGAASQRWQVRKTTGDYALIVNKESGLALTIQGNAVTDGNLLVQTAYAGNGTDYQQWKIYDSTSKEILTPNVNNSGNTDPDPTPTPTPTPDPKPNTDPQKKTYTVQFAPANGGQKTTVTVTEGATVSTPKQPVRKGYTFDGWYAGSTKYDFSKAVTSNLTLTAKWTKVSVKKAAISSLKAKKGRTVTLTAKKISGVKGYKVTYSTKKNFKKSVKVKYITSNKLTLKKLKKGTYYFKVQAYKLDSAGNKVLGKAGAVKKVVVKK